MGMTNVQKDRHKEFSFELSTAVAAKGKKKKKKSLSREEKESACRRRDSQVRLSVAKVWIYASTDLGISSSVGDGIFPTGNRQPQESTHGNLLSCA